MMKQYESIKQEHQDAFLFFRLGDFYELFHDDAELAARELEITLTKRGKGEEAIPMCGVPHHSSEHYIAQLVEKGYKVAVCEQTEDPQAAKGVVRREVVQVITPGTVMSEKGVAEAANQYICAVLPLQGAYFLSAADLTTGEFHVTRLQTRAEVLEELSAFAPKEIITVKEEQEQWQTEADTRLSALVSGIEPDAAVQDGTVTASLNEAEARSCQLLLQYLHETAKRQLDHLQPAVSYEAAHFLSIDQDSRRNLELTKTLRDRKKQGSLLAVLDYTRTAMGGRMLKRWLERPVLHRAEAEARHALTDAFVTLFMERLEVQELLKGVYDLERLSGRVSFGNVNGRDLLQLKHSLQQLPALKERLRSLQTDAADEIAESMETQDDLASLLEASIKEDCPPSITEGNIIKDGYHAQLDEYRDAMKNGRSWIASLEKQEKEETGIKSLKVGFNKVFGYYIEVSRPNLKYLPEGRYERKQTLTNAERFITPELKEKERVILEAEDQSGRLEYELFLAVREDVKRYIPQLQKAAAAVSTVDVLQSFAEAAEQHQYVRPVFTEHRAVKLRSSRHPVVERTIAAGAYIENDIDLHPDRNMLLITGPNMAGKSTYMRQLALIVVMAQAGSFVPAAEAELPLFDHIFTRIGAADDLSQGQSTFMVEMVETKHAVTRATPNSLILLDEIGRGTSTYDGMALAQAVVEYIHGRIGAMTLFSTHYHELTKLDHVLEGLVNVHVSAHEENGSLTFLHKVVEGAADKSYGIHAARLAELPEELLVRASAILDGLEKQPKKSPSADDAPHQEAEQLTLFPVEGETSPAMKELKEIDPAHLTPMEALQLIDRWKQTLKEEGHG
ncbi:DNA mismatch repair protein MutS [Alkalicoccus chagannorensis]|uniref:DNA mismatch repair protein MutS n=1 Tax=Alkalicoccus chagannorensis TaxID=427072 RepID=UPI000478767B